MDAFHSKMPWAWKLYGYVTPPDMHLWMVFNFWIFSSGCLFLCSSIFSFFAMKPYAPSTGMLCSSQRRAISFCLIMGLWFGLWWGQLEGWGNGADKIWRSHQRMTWSDNRTRIVAPEPIEKLSYSTPISLNTEPDARYCTL